MGRSGSRTLRPGPASRNPPPPDSSPRSRPRAPSSRFRARRATASARTSWRSRPGSATPAGLVATARPTLVEVARELGEASGLSVRDGWTAHYVDQVDSPNPVQVRDWTGTRIPLHAVSSGQVFLAQLPAPTLSRYLAEPLEAFTPNTLTDAPALLERLRAVKREGHAWVRDEFAIGISSVAAPIADARGEIVAAIHVHGPTYRFPEQGAEEAIALAVRAAASRIGVRLRGAPR